QGQFSVGGLKAAHDVAELVVLLGVDVPARSRGVDLPPVRAEVVHVRVGVAAAAGNAGGGAAGGRHVARAEHRGGVGGQVLLAPGRHRGIVQVVGTTGRGGQRHVVDEVGGDLAVGGGVAALLQRGAAHPQQPAGVLVAGQGRDLVGGQGLLV